MTLMLAEESKQLRSQGEKLLQRADDLLCQSWNEHMWSAGEPIYPSPKVDQAVNGGYPWLEIQCSRCKTPRDVDLAALSHAATTCVHDLATRLRCRKCAKAAKRPAATLLQLTARPRHADANVGKTEDQMSSASEEPMYLFGNRKPRLRDVIPASPVAESFALRIDRKNPP